MVRALTTIGLVVPSAAFADEPPGCMTMSPTSATVAEQNVMLTFTFTVGTNGFAEDGLIEILFNASTLASAGHELFDFLMSPPNSNGAEPGFAEGSLVINSQCETAGAFVQTTVQPNSRVATFNLRNKALCEDDQIIMTYKGKMRNNAGTILWKYRTDADADENPEPPGDGAHWEVASIINDVCTNGVPQPFVFEPEDAAYVQLTAPADLVTNGPFKLALVAFDWFANEARAHSGRFVPRGLKWPHRRDGFC